jgi:hypothetical protein
VAPLAQRRQAQGLRVATIDVMDIYDTFGSGQLDPTAIRTFLDYAYHNWVAPAPLYVLLVGDGNYDFKNHAGWNPLMLIPPYLAEVDPWLGETATDNGYVAVEGRDLFPDMLIGRLPVETVAEATTVVNKIIQYEANPVPGGWNARHLFVADNPDFAGNFHHAANRAYQTLSLPFSGQRFYLANSLAESELAEYEYISPQALRTAFLARFNTGAGVITYHGHSSWHQWASEQLLRWSLVSTENDVTQLYNHQQLPVILEMTCFTGYFHHPEYPTLDESLLAQSGGGAIAVWGSTGLGVSTGHDTLQGGFYTAIAGQEKPLLGDALLGGKLALSNRGLNLDLLSTYTLFGDPALAIDFAIVPFDHEIYLPLLHR